MYVLRTQKTCSADYINKRPFSVCVHNGALLSKQKTCNVLKVEWSKPRITDLWQGNSLQSKSQIQIFNHRQSIFVCHIQPKSFRLIWSMHSFVVRSPWSKPSYERFFGFFFRARWTKIYKIDSRIKFAFLWFVYSFHFVLKWILCGYLLREVLQQRKSNMVSSWSDIKSTKIWGKYDKHDFRVYVWFCILFP